MGRGGCAVRPPGPVTERRPVLDAVEERPLVRAGRHADARKELEGPVHRQQARALEGDEGPPQLVAREDVAVRHVPQENRDDVVVVRGEHAVGVVQPPLNDDVEGALGRDDLDARDGFGARRRLEQVADGNFDRVLEHAVDRQEVARADLDGRAARGREADVASVHGRVRVRDRDDALGPRGGGDARAQRQLADGRRGAVGREDLRRRGVALEWFWLMGWALDANKASNTAAICPQLGRGAGKEA
mmetsp:Transcript_9355/g.28028  ORF Transcript_9355/g.28028 Transcript_9355/m.28028 type:complete len:245 (+) Transcript_9355:321-1055(+)